ncbi:MAG: FtsX-like permease family protein, partial [Ruthenibacterium sp.]
KKSYSKNIWRTIRQTISRFGAIFAIVALGVGFLAGLLATTPDMRYSGDVYFDDSKFYDVRILSSMGLTSDDVKALRAVDGVDEVMPSYYADMLVQIESTGDVLVTRIHSLPPGANDPNAANYLNRVELLEGRLPAASNECVVERGLEYAGNAVRIGDTLTITDDNKEPEDTFAVRSFTVVGFVSSSYYFSVEREPASVGNGSVALILYTPESSFDTDGIYTNIFLSMQGARAMNSLSDEYSDTMDEAVKRIEEISGARCDARLAQIKSDANETLGDAKKEYNDAKDEAQQKLSDAAAELADGRKKLADGQTELKDAKQQLDDGQKKYDDGRAELTKQSADGYATLAQAERDLAAGRSELASGQAAYNDGKAKYDAGKAQYDAGAAQLAQGEAFVAQYQPLIEQAELAMAGYQAAGITEASLQGTVVTASTAYQAAIGAAAIAYPTYATEQSAYLGACLAFDGAMTQAGYTDEAKWIAEKPADAAPLIAQRDGAKAAFAAAVTAGGDDPAVFLANADAAIATARTDFLTASGALIQYKTCETLAALRPQLDSTIALIAQNKPLLDATKVQLEAAAAQLTAAKAQLDAGTAKLTDGEAQLASGRTALENGLADASVQLNDAAKTLAEGRSEYTKGLNKLNTSRGDLAEGEQKYADAKSEADTKLADAAQKIADAEQEIADLETPEWYVMGREGNVSFSSFQSNAQKVEAIAKIFPLFFFLVAALVALTTMTRMVEEERLQIGTMKALGYQKHSIMAKYVFYAMAASVFGSIFGLLVGFNLFPTIIWNAYSMMYNLPKLYCQFNWPYALIASGAAIFCTLLATLNACWATLHEAPAQLMRPRAPKAGKRIFLEYITPLWKRMKFTHKVTARNLLLYKKRFFMTVIGIAGCTALLVTGFGLHDSISDIVNKQFGDIFTYDVAVTTKNAQGLDSETLRSALADTSLVADSMPVHQEKSINSYRGDSFTTYLLVPQESERLGDFVTLRQRISGKSVPFEPEKGIVITEKMSERTGYGIGDSIELKNADDLVGTFTITGVAENYVENYVYMSSDLYAQQYGSTPEFTTIFARMAPADSAKAAQRARDALSEKLLESDDVANLSFISDIKDSFTNMMAKIDTIVVVLIVCAALLAFVVLYNLTNINITEREKEIATIKVLGFFDKEVSAYVYRESAVLSLIGGLVGLVLGIFLHAFVIHNVEVDAVMFGRTIKG